MADRAPVVRAVLTGLVAVMLLAGLASAGVLGLDAEGAAPGQAAPSGSSGTSAGSRPSPPGLDDGPAPAVAPPAPAAVSLPHGRDISAYEGLGAWVDVYDYAPAYHRPREGPQVVPHDVDAMAARGVRTLFLQAARSDDRSPSGIVDHELVGRFLERAHTRGMRVVGWYLPKFGDVEADMANLARLSAFRFRGHQLDGIAVDIEYRREVPDHDERNRRLIEMSRRLRGLAPGQALGAIVYPPALLESIRPNFWPAFPWRDLAGSYDVWLPMAYWTEIPMASGHRDGYGYSAEAAHRLRRNVQHPSALVHLVGGVGDAATMEEVEGFVRAARESNVLGWSMYDYRTTSGEAWRLLAHD